MASHSLRSLPLEIDMTIYVGTTFRREWRWQPNGDEYQDFTGWSALMLVGPQGGTAITELTEFDGIQLTTQGQIVVTIPAVVTGTYAGADPIYSAVAERDVASLYYSLDLTDPAGFVLRFARGRLDLIVDVERQ